MKLLIISHVIHTTHHNKFYGYGPYIKEMNLWLKYADEVEIIAPLEHRTIDKIDLAYNHNNLKFTKVSSFNLIGMKNKLKTFIVTPIIFAKLILAMKNTDHIHLRCPGNMGLLGAIAQILFPSKIKTAKYAGNWDPNSIQPITYIWQKKILANTTLSKNMKVLVYGEWKNQSSNIIPFFTATYREDEKEDVEDKNLSQEIKLLFVGSLSRGKQPLIALESLKKLRDIKINARLDILGNGIERTSLETYIKKYNLSDYVSLHGNQNTEYVKEMYKKSHFLILMSKSEGWPKVVAEAMFWGCVPIVSRVSCVEYMLGYGNRGKIVEANSDAVYRKIEQILSTKEFTKLSSNAQEWSRKFTLNKFEIEIKKFIHEK